MWLIGERKHGVSIVYKKASHTMGIWLWSVSHHLTKSHPNIQDELNPQIREKHRYIIVAKKMRWPSPACHKMSGPFHIPCRDKMREAAPYSPKKRKNKKIYPQRTYPTYEEILTNNRNK